MSKGKTMQKKNSKNAKAEKKVISEKQNEKVAAGKGKAKGIAGKKAHQQHMQKPQAKVSGEKKVVVTKEAAILEDKHAALEGYKSVIHPMITEKSINMIEGENKLVFRVSKSANKLDIKNAVEGLYGVKVDHVNVLIDSKSRKRAFVKISKEFKASDIATKLGVL